MRAISAYVAATPLQRTLLLFQDFKFHPQPTVFFFQTFHRGCLNNLFSGRWSTRRLGNQSFTVYPLKGKDIRALKAEGVDFTSGKYSVAESADTVFTTAGFNIAEVDELPYPDVLKLHKAIIDETFGVPEEEKNS